MRSLRFTLCLVLRLTLCGARELRALDSELDAVVDSRGFAAERILDRFPSPLGDLSLALTGAAIRGVPTALLPAIVCPYLTAGPVELHGLIRELADPVAHGPATSLYDERAGICLDGSLQPGPRRGVVLSPFPRHLDLFWLREEAGPTTLGALSFARLPSEVDGTLFLLASVPPEGVPSAAWFPQARSSDSPYVLHGGGSLTAGGRPLTATIAGALSLSPVEPPGGYLRATLSHTSGSFHLTASAVGATPSFLLPDGGLPERMATAGLASGLLLPFGSAGGSYRAFVSRLPLLPVPYRESGQEAEVDLTLGKSPVRLAFRYEQQRTGTRLGRLVVDEELAGSLACDFAWTRLALSSAWSWSNLHDPKQSVEVAWTAGRSGGAEGPTFELALGCRLPGGRVVSSPGYPFPEEGWSAFAGAAGVAGGGLLAAGRDKERGGGSRENAAPSSKGEGGLPWSSRGTPDPCLTGRLSVAVPFGRGAFSLKVALANPVKLSMVDELVARPLKRLVVTATWHQVSEPAPRREQTGTR